MRCLALRRSSSSASIFASSAVFMRSLKRFSTSTRCGPFIGRPPFIRRNSATLPWTSSLAAISASRKFCCSSVSARVGQDLGWALDLRRLRRLRRRRGRGHRGWHRAPRQGPQHAAQPRADLCHGGRHRSEKDLMPTFVGTRLRAALAVGEHINAQHTLHQIGNCIPSIPLTFPGNFASPTTPRPKRTAPTNCAHFSFQSFSVYSGFAFWCNLWDEPLYTQKGPLSTCFSWTKRTALCRSFECICAESY